MGQLPSHNLPHRQQIRAVLLALLFVAGCHTTPADAGVPPITGTWETRDPRQGWRFTLTGRGSIVLGRYSNETIPALGQVDGSYHFPRVRLVFTVHVGLETVDCTLWGTMEEGGDQIAELGFLLLAESGGRFHVDPGKGRVTRRDNRPDRLTSGNTSTALSTDGRFRVLM